MNMVAALGLYCDLLEEPGVFSEPFRHYGSELKMVASASRGPPPADLERRRKFRHSSSTRYERRECQYQLARGRFAAGEEHTLLG